MGLPCGKDAKTLLQTTIRSFLSSGGPLYLVLDTRPRAVFRAKHLSPSTNIPLDRLDGAWFQLPAKQTPFAVLEAEQHTAIATNPCSGQTRSIDILKRHGWDPQCVFQDHPLFWSTVAEELSIQPRSPSDKEGTSNDNNKDHHIQIIESSLSTRSFSQLPYHFLFKPNPVLVKILPQIEQELIHSRSINESFKTGPLLRCLDVGCGSGRDMIYMVARSANGQAIHGAQWSALGLDQREDMCVLVQQLAKDTFLQDDGNDNNDRVPDPPLPGKALVARVGTIIGKVDPTTGILWATSPTSDSIRNSQPLLRVQNIRYNNVTMDQAHQRLLNESTSSTALDERFDLIVMIRFLQRSLFAPMVHHWLRPGGFLILSTFVSDHDLPQYSKPGPAHRLQSKTEAREILEALGLKIVMEEISLIEDGVRPVATVVARKPS